MHKNCLINRSTGWHHHHAKPTVQEWYNSTSKLCFGWSLKHLMPNLNTIIKKQRSTEQSKRSKHFVHLAYCIIRLLLFLALIIIFQLNNWLHGPVKVVPKNVGHGCFLLPLNSSTQLKPDEQSSNQLYSNLLS